MTTEEKILQALEHIQADVKDLKHGQQEQGATITRLEQGQIRVEQGQGRTHTVLKVLEAGQNDVRENMASKADVQDIKAEQAKQKRRIENLEETTSDFYFYTIQKYHAPFDLDIDQYPDTWLTVSLAEIQRAIQNQFVWGTELSNSDLIDALKLLQNKSYLSIEDWELFEDANNGGLYSDYRGRPSRAITCWLYRTHVDYAVTNYYNAQLVTPLVDERIDIKREKRIVSNQGHRAKRIGQAASLTFEEWTATISYFNLRCAFCQERPYEVLEHFIPIIHGGTTSVFNCIPACERCNAIKNDRHPLEIIQEMGEERIHEIQCFLDQHRQEWIQKTKGN